MSTPTAINEEYDIVIAGGEPLSASQSFLLLTACAFNCNRGHSCVRRRR